MNASCYVLNPPARGAQNHIQLRKAGLVRIVRKAFSDGTVAGEKDPV